MALINEEVTGVNEYAYDLDPLLLSELGLQNQERYVVIKVDGTLLKGVEHNIPATLHDRLGYWQIMADIAAKISALGLVEPAAPPAPTLPPAP
jgi:hypothetical protein